VFRIRKGSGFKCRPG